MSGYSSESDVWDRPAYDIVGTEVTVIANPLKVKCAVSISRWGWGETT